MELGHGRSIAVKLLIRRGYGRPAQLEPVLIMESGMLMRSTSAPVTDLISLLVVILRLRGPSSES